MLENNVYRLMSAIVGLIVLALVVYLVYKSGLGADFIDMLGQLSNRRIPKL